MTAVEIIEQLRPLGSESYKKVMRNHGIPEPLFGVKISDLKKFQKQIKQDYQLALDLYDTGNYDAMYLAGLIADDARMSKKDLKRWIKQAHCPEVAEFTVAWVATGSPHGHELALEWIESKNENTACAGWSTLAGIVSVRNDADLDIAQLEGLLERVQKTIHAAPNRVRYEMNNFVISVGCYVRELTDLARRIGTKIGPVEVDMGNTDCHVPYAPDYIDKVKRRGTIGKKRKSAKC